MPREFSAHRPHANCTSFSHHIAIVEPSRLQNRSNAFQASSPRTLKGRSNGDFLLDKPQADKLYSFVACALAPPPGAGNLIKLGSLRRPFLVVTVRSEALAATSNRSAFLSEAARAHLGGIVAAGVLGQGELATMNRTDLEQEYGLKPV